jgi:peptidoglycan/xylan/chitin deacetylase (PgdA/CDA1 family)
LWQVLVGAAVVVCAAVVFVALRGGFFGAGSDVATSTEQQDMFFPSGESEVGLVLEYGEPAEIVDFGPPLHAFIRYPQTGQTAVDAEISQWANGLHQDVVTELAAKRADDGAIEAEVNVQYQSYRVSERYAGIAMAGNRYFSRDAHPAGVAGSFNVDIEAGRILANDEVIDPAKRDEVLKLLREKIAARILKMKFSTEIPPALDASWLRHIILTHKGIVVMLNQAEHLPAYLGLQTFTLSYDELGSALLLDVRQSATSAPLAPPAQPEPPAPPARTLAVRTDLDPNKPMIALTFDDGPSDHTTQVLDLLEQQDVRATFCVIGSQVAGRSETVARASNLNCEIIGHSWDHRQLTNLSPDEIRAELVQTREAIEAACGVTSNLYRPTYGAVNETVETVSRDAGFAMVNWSIDSLDWSSRDASAVYDEIMANVHDRGIILCHDLYASTAEAMQRVIPELKAQGYQLVTLSELLYYSGKTVEPGQVYYNG